MTKLSVNINKVATLRNARGGNNPDVLSVALDCERFGAQGITVHPRPDERHIRRADVYAIKPALHTEFNIEGYPSDDFCRLVLDVKPAQVTLVPDAPGQITSNAGWDTLRHRVFLTETVARFRDAGIRTSIFVAADEEMVAGAAAAGADRVELYTEPYATDYAASLSKAPASFAPASPTAKEFSRDPFGIQTSNFKLQTSNACGVAADREAAIAPFIAAARKARELGLGLNAGHDLSLQNLRYFHQQIPWLDEVSIGHALICDALYLGLKETISRYLSQLQ